MRKIAIFVTFLVVAVNAISHTQEIYELYDESIERVVRNRVPDKFVETFLYYSDNPEMKPLRLHFLAIAEIESQWIWMKSFQLNGDGSYDVGPMGLNTTNIDSEKFMDLYAPKDRSMIDNDDQLWMVIGMNYFTDMYNWRSVGKDAFYIYNAGPGRYLNGTLPDITIRYHRRALQFLRHFADEASRYTEYYAMLRRINNYHYKLSYNNIITRDNPTLVLYNGGIMDIDRFEDDETNPSLNSDAHIDEERNELITRLVERFGRSQPDEHEENHLKEYIESILRSAVHKYTYRVDDPDEFVNDPENELPSHEKGLYLQLRDTMIPDLFRKRFGIFLQPDGISNSYDFEAMCILYEWLHVNLRSTFNYFVSQFLIDTNAIDDDFIAQRKFAKVQEYLEHSEYNSIILNEDICTLENFVRARVSFDMGSIDVDKISEMVELNDITFDPETFFDRIQKIVGIRDEEGELNVG